MKPLCPARFRLLTLSVLFSIPSLLLSSPAAMSESREAAYSHMSEHPAQGEEETFPLFRRPYRRIASPASRALLVAALVTLVLALLTVAITLLVSAADSGGGGGGGGGHAAGWTKCSAYPPFNLTGRRPDPSILKPALRIFDVNHT